MKKCVYIVCGPTSSGKTSLAIDLCKKYNGEIISADSRQVCRDMNIGTGKVPISSREHYATAITLTHNDGQGGKYYVLDGVKVWGYDLFFPDEYFSGVDWCLYALNKATEILSRNKTVFLVGGTGFYLDLFTGRIKPSRVKPDIELRKELEDISLRDLQEELKNLNLDIYEKVDKHNKVRLIRSIEKELAKEERKEDLPYLATDFIWVGLNASRDILYKRCDCWVDSIWRNGLVDETKYLLKKYPSSIKLDGLVYKSVIAFIKGDTNEEHSVQRVKYDLHAYIRRQQTYFRKNKNILWVDISKDDFKQIIYNIING